MTAKNRKSVLLLISDLHKDVYGFRPSVNYSTWSDEKLFAEWDYLAKRVDEIIEQEKKEKAAAWRYWMKTMEVRAKDLNTSLSNVIRWDIEAHDVNGDLGFYCWQYDLSYEKEKEVRRLLLA